ncbi:response regulator receiver domain [uncultured Roseibium sp.]|uniref:response regulator receiver domain n=1 Tax=uncultured Roseibium sp. TaxID=1936171 RepID=UPI003216D802
MTITETVAAQEDTFDDLSRKASAEFLQTVVVIDDTPRRFSKSEQPGRSEKKATKAPSTQLPGLPSVGTASRETTVAAPAASAGPTKSTIAKDPVPKTASKVEKTADVNGEGEESEDSASPQEGSGGTNPHAFDFIQVTKSFSEHGIICGSYYPENSDEVSIISENAFSVSKQADVLVIDWHLKEGFENPAKPTIDTIIKVIKDDIDKSDRLRLILVYTGEEIAGLSNRLKSSIEEVGISDAVSILEDNTTILVGKNSRIKFISKPTNKNASNPIEWKQLPEIVIEEYSKLSKGLLRNFALHATAAIRSKLHQTLAVFDPELDGAFVAHKAISPDPEEAEAYIVEILSATMEDIAVHSNSIHESLSAKTCTLWMKQNGQQRELNTKLVPKDPGSLKGKVDFVDSGNPSKLKATILTNTFLLENGTNEKFFKRPSSEQGIPILQSFYADDQKTKHANHRLAEVSLFTVRAKDGSKTARNIFLTTGTVLKSKVEQDEKFYLCIQPRCDSVRLDPCNSWTFPFVRLEVVSEKGDFSIVDDNKVTELKLISKPNTGLKIVQFMPDKEFQYVVPTVNSSVLTFEDTEKNTYEWIGELRPMHAQNYITKIVEQLNRIGVTGSEWLRANQRHQWNT